MPSLTFYAVDDDWSAVLETVFDLGLFRVFETRSEPDRDLREFHARTEVPDGLRGQHLALFATGSGPVPRMNRTDSRRRERSATSRYHCEGWGLIYLHHGWTNDTQLLRWSHTNHNTEKRATAWSSTIPELGDPAAWDWTAVTHASGRLNRAIRRTAVSKIGSHPVLPHAARLIANAGLRYEYGAGIHATPSIGMTRA